MLKGVLKTGPLDFTGPADALSRLAYLTPRGEEKLRIDLGAAGVVLPGRLVVYQGRVQFSGIGHGCEAVQVASIRVRAI